MRGINGGVPTGNVRGGYTRGYLRAVLQVGAEVRAAVMDEEVWMNSRCAVHKEVVHGLEGVVGCGSAALGHAGFIAAATRADGQHAACLSPPDQRAKDREFAVLVYEQAFRDNPFSPSKRVRDKFCNSDVVDMAAFGAAYCHLRFVNKRVRARVARVLGPLPPLIDALAFADIFPAEEAVKFQLQRVADGACHVVTGQGAGFVNRATLYQRAVQVFVEEGLAVRVGVTDEEFARLKEQLVNLQAAYAEREPGVPGAGSLVPERYLGKTAGNFGGAGDPFGLLVPVGSVDMEALLGRDRIAALFGWFDSVGVSMPKKARFDVGMATCTVSGVPGGIPGAKDRLRLVEGVGDAFLKYMSRTRAFCSGATLASATGAEALHVNHALVAAFHRWQAREHCRLGGTPGDSTKLADLVEQVIGVVAVWRTNADAYKVAVALGLFTRDVSLGAVAAPVEVRP